MIYNKYSTYLKNKYGHRVHRISIDTGFGCPNSCIYCNNKSFNHFQKFGLKKSLEYQIETGFLHIRKRFEAKKFILYFQSGTNTFADIETLKKTFDLVRAYKDFVGLNIATRPDSVNDEILELIASYCNDYEVFIEYGLQTIHNQTLKLINRGHTYEDFVKIYKKTKDYGISVCAHLILGLPFETESMILDTAKAMTGLNIDAVKLHPMHIVKDTKLADIWQDLEFYFFEFEKYQDLLAKFLANLDEKIIVTGLNGYCPKEILIKPAWLSEYNIIVKSIEKYMQSQNLKQGCGVKS